ncbi:MAG TPA: response regulator transcription factor [Acetobacteraceae bacterium]|nr:response regulator transcription factor [Acetobacteraceae bacterium]
MHDIDEALCVLVADQQELFRRGVIGVLRDSWPLWSCAHASGIEEIRHLLAREAANLLIVELALPGLGGPAGIQQLRALHPHCTVVVLGGSDDRATVLESLGAGAQGYVAKSATPTQLLRAVEAVLCGAVVAPASLAGRHLPAEAPRPPSRQAPAAAPPGFTGRQADVFRLLAEGCATKTIARRLNLAAGTVKVHLAAIYRQLGVHGRVEALARFRDIAIADLVSGEAGD